MTWVRRYWSLTIVVLLGCPGGDPVGDGTGGSSGGSTSMTTAPTTTMTGSTGVVDGTTAEATDGGGLGCCDRHSTPTCEEQEVTECVCNMRAECCAFEWSQRCVDLAIDECDATCMPDDATTGGVDPTTGGVGSGDSDGSGGSGGTAACCMPAMAPGCAEDTELEQCVCGQDPFCCEEQWDGKCVGIAVGACGAECGGGQGGEGDCCMPNQSPGCEDPMIQDCVCMADPFCCNEMWDGKCVQTAMGACMACG